MNKDDKNIKAFPCELPRINHPNYKGHEGMDLRDYFAAKAMLRILPDITDLKEQSEYPMNPIARVCYAMADAMMQERSKTK